MMDSDLRISRSHSLNEERLSSFVMNAELSENMKNEVQSDKVDNHDNDNENQNNNQNATVDENIND